MLDPAVRLYPIIDAEVCAAHGVAPEQAARACLLGGARLLQVRAKGIPSARVLTIVDAVVAAAREHGARVIVNDRADLALMAGADGVHVGQDDLPPEEVRSLGPHLLIGESTHDLEQVAQALGSPSDYIAVGPIYGTRTKETGYEPRGLDFVREAAGRGKPVVAIGGITLGRARDVIAAGASMVAVISDLFASADVEMRVREFVAALDG